MCCCGHNRFSLSLRLLACVVLLASPAALQAQETTFELDPAKTTVEFALGATLHAVHGTFKSKSGTIRFNPASGEASGSIVIDATSGNSDNESRDRKMHEVVLESKKYPEIVLTPIRVTGAVAEQGDSTVEVQGVLRIHGADHEVTLSVAVHVSGDAVTAKTHFVVPYVAWGLKNPSTFVLRVSKEVEIEVSSRGRIVSGTTSR